MDELQRIKAIIERDREAIQPLHDEYREDARFAIKGEQWTDTQESKRKKRGKPSLTYNRLPGFVRIVVNGARQQEQTGRVYPQGDKANKATAEILEGAVRAVQIASDAQSARDTALECAVVGGFGWYRVVIEDLEGQPEPRIEAIRDPLTVVWDSSATRADRLDARHVALMVQMDREAFKAKYTRDPVDYGDDSRTWAPSENTVTVCEFWEKDENGRVTQTIMDGKGELDGDEDYVGGYLPFIFLPGEEYFVDGRTLLKGIVRDAKEPQRFINFWKSEIAHQLDLRKTPPAIVGATSITDPVTRDIYSEWKNDSDTTYRRINENSQFVPQFPQAPGVPVGAATEAAQAVDDLKASIGMYDASLGARSNEQSGRAILARQAQGDLSTFHFIRALERAVRVETLIVMDLLLKLYPSRKWIQIAAEDGTVTTQELGAVMKLRDGSKEPATLQEGSYGVLVKSGPAYSTRRQQFAEILPQIVQSAPLIGEVGADLLVNAIEMGPGGDMLSDRLRWAMEQRGLIQPKEEEQGSPEQASRDLAEALKALKALQGELQQWQATAQTLQEQASGEQAKAQAQAATDIAKTQSDAAVALEKARIDAETRRQTALIDRDSRLEVARIQAETNILIAQMKEQGSTDREAVKADATVTAAALSAPSPSPSPAPVDSEEEYQPGAVVPEGMYP